MKYEMFMMVIRRGFEIEFYNFFNLLFRRMIFFFLFIDDFLYFIIIRSEEQ